MINNPLRKCKEIFFSEVTEMPPLLGVSHIPSLDGLRAVSILLVLVYHVMIKMTIHNFKGDFGVDIFFVISGFIITTLLYKERINKGNISLKRFYIRRSLKIIPIAYAYLGIVVLLNFHYHFTHLKDIASAGLFIKNTQFIPTHLDLSTGHFWSLSVEEQFYIIFPFILVKSKRSYLLIISLLLILLPVLFIYEDRNSGIFGKQEMHTFIELFRYSTPILTGVLFSLLIFKKVIRKRIYPNNLATNLLLLGAAYWVFSYGGDYFNYYKYLASSLLIALVVVNNAIPSNDLFFKFLNSKIMVTIGLASYSIYVWQQIFLLQVPWEYSFKNGNSVSLNVLAMIVVAFCSYYFVERNIAKYKSRFR